MKNFNFKKISLSLLIVALAICSIFGISYSEKSNVTLNAATVTQEIPNYFTVKQYTKFEEGQDAKPENNVSIDIGNGEVAYVSTSNKVEAKLFIPSQTANNPIKSVMPFVKFNGNTINSTILDDYSIELSYNVSSFLLISRFDNIQKFAPYGKYEIKLEYIIENNEGIQENKTINFTYFIVKDSDYYNGKNVNTQVINSTLVEKDNISQVYDRIYQYNYSFDDTKSLPTLTFNKKYINVEIIKTFQKTMTKQKIWFDGTNVLTDNNIVYTNISQSDDTVSVVFNDLGSYAIKYNFTYFKDNKVEDILPAINIFTNIKKSDLIEVFGYQLYYSDSQTSNLKEFKEIDENGVILDKITDLSYKYTTFNEKIENKQSEILNSTQDPNVDASYDGIFTLVKNKKIDIQKTNQAPVQFKYNVEIITEPDEATETCSKLWHITRTINDDKQVVYDIDNGEVYDNKPLSESGIYLINTIYKYYPTVLGSDEACNSSKGQKLRSQWFLFEITKETAKVKVSNSTGNSIPDEYFINEDVTIKKEEEKASIFNAATVLELYMQENYVGPMTKIATIESNQEYVATKNGRYEVKMLFGKNLTRSYSSTFTIDKDPIENIQIFAVNKYENSNLYYRTSQIDFMTNQSVTVSWNNKASSSIITAQYKFIPIVYANAAFDNSLLKQFYENYQSIPANYYLDFNQGKKYIEADYANTADKSSIPAGNILSQSGMYIFKVQDTAGNEKYFSFIIDKAPARILQQVKGDFVEPSQLNTLSSDVKIVWGQYKVTEFTNMVYQSGEFKMGDPWINEIFNNTDVFSQYFEMMQISTSNRFFVKSKIDQKVLMATDGIYGWLTDTDSVDIKFLESDNQAAEHDYKFYIRDQVNTKTLVGLPADSFENYLDNYSATHRVKISSDSSLSELVYTKNGELTSLLQNSYNKIGDETIGEVKYSKKDKYFEPTTKYTLAESNEILNFIFMPVPESGVLEIDTVSYEYTPFAKTEYKDTSKNLFAYTYSFDVKNKETNLVYSKSEPQNNKTFPYAGFDGMLCWEINKEFNSVTSTYQTKPGKYTITRTYANLSNTHNKVNESHDFMIRTLTFIIDRNGILSSPVLTESSTEKLYSYVGDSIKIQVLEDENSKMFFEDIFLATNNVSSGTPILETNKLPVFVLIPTYKYGYSFKPGSSFHIEDSIGYYSQIEKEESKIDAFTLSAEIKYSKESSTIDQSTTIYRSRIDKNDGYLKFDGISSTSGRAFTNVGYYKVTIKQGIREYGQNKFTFTFRIKTGTPSFTVNNTITNEELSKFNNNYYTNQEMVRLSWEDPESKFEAKINKDEIYYAVNNGAYQKIGKNLIKTIGRLNTIDLNIKSIEAYTHNATINISMQFEGNEIDYTSGSFKKIKTIVIDTVAPQANINKLVALSGIDSKLVRNEQIKYNTSVSTGLYKYYSYCIDVSNIEQIIDFTSHLDGETYSMYYRVFVNPENNESTKYNNIYQQETLPSEIENSTTNFTKVKFNILLNDLKNDVNLRNKYIEIAEIDLAGNITIYTIYLTDVTVLAENIAINYKNNGIAKSIKYKDIKDETNIYAKSSFDFETVQITDFAWNKITIGNTSYLKTPYSENMYYNLSIYDETNPSKSAVLLTTFGKLKPNSQIQTVSIELLPLINKMVLKVAVLNTSLSVIHTSSTSLYANEEGIMIKIPASTIVQDAKIYAVSVEINQYIKDAHDKDIKQTLYSLNDDTFFSVQQPSLQSPATITLSYVIYMGSTYLKLKVAAPVANRFYTYSITDNFSDVYPITSIYGSEKIEQELSSYVDIVEKYENGKLFHYSTKNTFFKYNSAKDKITLAVATTSYTSIYDFSKQEDIIRFNSSGYGKLTIPVKNSVVYTVEMYAPKLDMAEGVVGSEYNFTINKFTAIDEISTGLSYDTINLVLYNIVPNIYLYGAQNQPENELFNKGTMYGNSIKISFRHNIGRIPCVIYLQYEDGTTVQIASDTIVSKPAVYTLIIKYTDIFTDSQYDVYLDFTISDNDEEFYKVVYTENDKKVYATQTGKPFSYVDGNKTYSVETHFILNTTDFDIIYNTEQGIEAVSIESFTTGGFLTYFYTLSNQNSTTATSFFNRTIAITVIPKTNNILKHFSYYENEGNPKLLTGSLSSFIVSKEESNIGYKRISWQSYYGIPENTIDVTIFFGDNQTIYKPTLTTDNNITSIQLTSSGTYYLQFKDKAGNFHMFTQSTGTYTIRYLRSVIYNVNGKSPINNAIYDSEVIVNVPTSTSKYYDPNAQPKLSALKNGAEYRPETDRSNFSYTFKEPGLYKIWFSAAVTDKDTGVVKEINEEPLYFLIINPKESRWSFEFSEYSTYYVKEIIRNGVDVTTEFTNSNIGNITTKQVEENGQLVKKPYLKNFLISVNDIATGRGEYTITIATDNEFNQEFAFSFWINNTTPSIKVSVEQNTETTKVITVSFNTIDLLEDVGDCQLSIRAGSRSTILDLNKKALESNKIQDNYNLKIEEAGTYYIQLFSESGKLLYSYRVIKKDPLNAVSIIVIVSVTLVTVGLTVVFIVLRKRMKIK